MPSSQRTRLPSLALLLIGVVLPTLVTWLYFVAMAGEPALWQQASYSVGKLVQFALPLVWWLGFRPRSEATRPNYTRSVQLGIASGLTVLLAGWCLHTFILLPQGFYDASLPLIQAKVRGMNLDAPAVFIALSLFYSLVHSFLEEYYWRWFVFRESRQRLSLPGAIVLSSLGFMAHHVLVLGIYFGWTSPLTWFFSLSVAIGGAFWAWLYKRYGTLLGPWLSHLLIDALIFAIGYQLVLD